MPRKDNDLKKYVYLSIPIKDYVIGTYRKNISKDSLKIDFALNAHDSVRICKALYVYFDDVEAKVMYGGNNRYAMTVINKKPWFVGNDMQDGIRAPSFRSTFRVFLDILYDDTLSDKILDDLTDYYYGVLYEKWKII